MVQNKQKNVRIAIKDVDSEDSCCRICQQEASKEALVSACNCKGSLKFVHQTCLQEWVHATRRTSCELCYFQFKVVQVKRYKCCHSVCVWLRLPSVRSHLRAELVVVTLLTMITVILCCFCYYILISEKRHEETWSKVTVILIFMIALTWYVKEIFCLIKADVQYWLRWWRSCLTMKIVIEDRRKETAELKNSSEKLADVVATTQINDVKVQSAVERASVPHLQQHEYIPSSSCLPVVDNSDDDSEAVADGVTCSTVFRVDGRQPDMDNTTARGVPCVIDQSISYTTPLPSEREISLCSVVLNDMEKSRNVK